MGRGRERRGSGGLAQGICGEIRSVSVDVAIVGIRKRAKTSLSLKIRSLHMILARPDEKNVSMSIFCHRNVTTSRFQKSSFSQFLPYNSTFFSMKARKRHTIGDPIAYFLYT